MTDGRIININMPTGKTVYSGGTLENITRKTIDVGDVIKIAPFVTKAGDLSAHWCDPCLLDAPSANRLQEYSKLRAIVKHNISIMNQNVKNTDYKQSRAIIGETRALELTAAELKIIANIIRAMPEIEKPMQSSIDKYNPLGKRDSRIETIDNSYNTRLESMTIEEFVNFTKDAVIGKIKKLGQHGDTSYLFGIAEDFGVDAKTRESLILDCIEARLPKIRGKPYTSRTFDDKYNIDQALKYLAGLGTESSFNRSVAYIKSFVDGKDFKELEWRERSDKKEDFLFGAVSAFNSYLDVMPLNLLERELPYFRQLKRYLIKNADEPITVNILERTIDHIEEKIIGN